MEGWLSDEAAACSPPHLSCQSFLPHPKPTSLHWGIKKSLVQHSCGQLSSQDSASPRKVVKVQLQTSLNSPAHPRLHTSPPLKSGSNSPESPAD